MVIGTDTDRLATYDFLLVIHTTMSLSRTVSEINSDICKILLPVYLALPLRGSLKIL